MREKASNPQTGSSEPRMDEAVGTRQQELRLFLFITIVLFPLLSVVLVGGFGFSVWISQMIFGPPSA